MIVAPMTNRRIATLVALGIVLLAAADVVGVVRGTTATASAQQAAPTADELKQAKEAFLAGKKLFDAKKFAEAVEKFKDSYRLSHNPALLFNIALTFSELGSKDMALFYYKKYLTDAPADAAQRPDAEAAVAEIEAEKQADDPPDEVKPPPDDGDEVKPPRDEVKPPPDEVKPPRRTDYTIDEFEHTVVDEAPPGTPLDLMASPDDAPWAVTVYYRGPHDEKFNAVPMTSHHNTLVARIPAKAMAGNAVQYYVEVKDAAGALLTRIGKSTSPNVIYLDANAKAQYFPDFGDDSPADTGGGRLSDDDSPPGFGDDRPPPPGGGREVVIGPSGPGFTDVGSSKFKMAKWAATGTGLGMLTLSVTFGLMSSSFGASLEAEAAVSNDENCTEGQPCRTYDDYRKGIEDTGQRYELISRIALGVGVVGTGLAAWFWYKEITARKHAERVGTGRSGGMAGAPATGVRSIVTAPLVGDDLFGAAAALRF